MNLITYNSQLKVKNTLKVFIIPLSVFFLWNTLLNEQQNFYMLNVLRFLFHGATEHER